jgi:hypothetical protein
MTIDLHPRLERLTCRLTGHLWLTEEANLADGTTGEAYTCRRCGMLSAHIEPWERSSPRGLSA